MKVYLMPIAGLGNRVRAIESICSILNSSDIEKKKLTIFWPVNSDLNCKFEKIFDFKEDYLINKKGLKSWIVTNLFRYGLIIKYHKYIVKILQMFFDYVFIPTSENEALKMGEQLNSSLHSVNTKRKKVFIISFYEFKSDWYLNNLKFKKQIIQASEEYYKLLGNYTHSMHIRRGDHVNIINSISKTIYFDFIKKIVAENPINKIFIATDDMEIRNELKELFKKNVIFYQSKHLSRNSEEGILEAIIELLLLSKAKNFAYTSMSSFGLLAFKIGNFEKNHNLSQ